MPDEDNVIDVEAEEIPDSAENLPAVIPQPRSHVSDEAIEAHAVGKTPDGRDWPHGPTPDRRCRAHKKTGEQCKNAAILGSTVCRFHGGAAKHVKRAARARLDNAADLMAKHLLRIAVTGESEAVRLQAIRDALDRAGIAKPTEVVLSQGEAKPYEELFEGIGTISRAESRRARGVPDTQDNFAGFASSTEGSEYLPPTQGETANPNQPADPLLRRESLDPTTDPRDSGHQRQPRRPQRHVTGDDAIRLANQANRQIGALKAIESSHKRYPRP